MAKLPPGPPNGITGFRHIPTARRGLVGMFRELAEQYGETVYYRIGPIRFYQFATPDSVRAIFLKHLDCFKKPYRLKQVFGLWNGRGLLLADGRDWQRKRRMVQGAMHRRDETRFAEIAVRQTVRYLQGLADRTQADASTLFERIAFAYACEAIYGPEIHDTIDELCDAYDVLHTFGVEEMFNPFPTPLWFPLPRNRRVSKARRFVRRTLYNAIADRRQQPRDDLLSLLITSQDDHGGHPFTDRQVHDEATGLLLGGKETTGAGMAWTAYLLARHPEVQAEAAREIDQVLGGSDVTSETLSRLKYLEMVFKESLRLYPPVYALTRKCVKTVEVEGYRIRPWSEVYVATCILHRSPRWFDQPDAFRPSRFAPDAPEIPHFAYVPFGAGPRACVGRGMGMVLGIATLATVLARYQIQLAPGQSEPEPDAGIAMRPKNLNLVLVERSATRQPGHPATPWFHSEKSAGSPTRVGRKPPTISEH